MPASLFTWPALKWTSTEPGTHTGRRVSKQQRMEMPVSIWKSVGNKFKTPVVCWHSDKAPHLSPGRPVGTLCLHRNTCTDNNILSCSCTNEASVSFCSQFVLYLRRIPCGRSLEVTKQLCSCSPVFFLFIFHPKEKQKCYVGFGLKYIRPARETRPKSCRNNES